MPFALAAGAGEVAASLLLFLLCVASAYLIKAIAASIPDFSIPVVSVSLPIGKWFKDATNPIVAWLTNASKALWADTEFWMRGISYIFDGIFGDIRTAFDADAKFIAHLFNTSIPDAISTSESKALSLIDGASSTIEAKTKGAANDVAAALTAADRAIYKDIANTETDIRADIRSAVSSAVDTAESYADTLHRDLKTYVEDAIKALPKIPKELVAGIDYATPAAVAAVAAGAYAISEEFTECAVTTCDGPNNLQGLLNGILGLAGLADFAVFLSDAINDPAGVEQKYANYFSSVTQGVIGGGGDIFGAVESVLGL